MCALPPGKKTDLVTAGTILRTTADDIERVLRKHPAFVYPSITTQQLNALCADLGNPVYLRQVKTCRAWLRFECTHEHLKKNSGALMMLVDDFGRRTGGERVNSDWALLVAAHLDGYGVRALPVLPRCWQLEAPRVARRSHEHL